ncbi:10609_t:CDS:1 [Dentiscutata erythropus]|uniref:10609_t:CDS:1 n=1 Tax=Dentiscutata erythropus TaxID=1348616 RepID=A0A9N9IGM8_9GLOM|nr:10609_t:CDS:1 [Dentiscutata erythropus]
MMKINCTSSYNLKKDEQIIRASSINQKYSDSTSLASLMKKSLTCPSGTYACTDSDSRCCPEGSTCLPNFHCSSSKGDINKILTLGLAFTLLFSICLILI